MRIPVVDKDGKPLMPTKPSRARRWLKDGKAVKKWSDLGVFYVQLTVSPSDSEIQDVVVGVDPGKLYSGIGVQSPKATLFMAHLVLPFETVKKRMEQRRMMRHARRGRRINRDAAFNLRNHRQKRIDNRKGRKLPPSIRSNRQLEYRVVKELSAIFPVTQIVWEYVSADVDLTSGRKGARSGKGFSPVMVGQRWAIAQMSTIAPVVKVMGRETAKLRCHLGLTKSKDKAQHAPQSHTVDGVALAASRFVSYRPFRNGRDRGKEWMGDVMLTDCLFKVIRRPPVCRRQLHLLQPTKGGGRRNYGGTVTRHGFRKGDLVRAERAGKHYIGWVSGDTSHQVSVSDSNWRRLAQFTCYKVELIQRSVNLLVHGESSPVRIVI